MLSTLAGALINVAPPSPDPRVGGQTTNIQYPSPDSPNPGVPVSFQITVNSEGFGLTPSVGQVAYQNSQGTLVNTGINSGSPRALGFVLLHELGHATGVLPPDANSAANENSNNSQVANNCKKTLQGLSNAASRP